MMQLTERGAYVVAGIAGAALATMLVGGQIDHPDRQSIDGPGVIQSALVCADGLDGRPGVACLHPGDVPTDGTGLAPAIPASVPAPANAPTLPSPPVVTTPTAPAPAAPVIEPGAPVIEPAAPADPFAACPELAKNYGPVPDGIDPCMTEPGLWEVATVTE